MIHANSYEKPAYDEHAGFLRYLNNCMVVDDLSIIVWCAL